MLSVILHLTFFFIFILIFLFCHIISYHWGICNEALLLQEVLISLIHIFNLEKFNSNFFLYLFLLSMILYIKTN